MPSDDLFDGNEWERRVSTLLSLRYGAGGYQRVPAQHRGDAGIDGFSVSDGNCYQSYAPAQPLPVRDLYERQRDKITADINKFITNSARLSAILGTIRVRRWVLVVPEHSSADLIEHAATKTALVLASNLPYVADDFRVMIHTEADFAVESRTLSSSGVARVRTDASEPTSEQIDGYLSSESTALVNLRRKIAALHSGEHNPTFAVTVRTLVRAFLVGAAELAELQTNYPEVYSEVRAAVRRTEDRIMLQSLIDDRSAREFLRQTLESIERDVGDAAPAVRHLTTRIAQQAIADMLMRCPLSFGENAASGESLA
ncbi:MAG: hypothetical protein KIT38_13260 [Gemmatimonadaceae bacterium]|nr:hypothetical protein [Gemmatimonadaceae bacterium]